ncbi:MAG: hypothetical protein H7Z13_04335 [Ferruginibacter sp.]|nr:hypothetical protein [Ferruginibacter sp.]
MKKQSNILFTKLGEYVLANLTREVKETLAVGIKLPAQKTFTVTDLWNIQRQKKQMVQRRFLL